MFAVALWTESQKRLVLVRDRMGIKPLYYYRSGDDLYFGSELKAILEHPEVPRHLDLDALDTYLSLNYVPGPQTLIEGIRKVPPGHLLEWRHGKVRERSVVEAARAARREASRWARPKRNWTGCCSDSVREHLVSDVPLGVWASGGLDSSTILHYAAAQTAGRLKTFSVSFQGRSFDESPYFREIARDLRDGPSRIRFESGRGAAERDRGLRVLFGRTERGRGRAAGLVPLADEPAARDGGAFGRRRGRVVRRLSDVSWRTGWCGRSGMVPARTAAADARRAGPVHAGVGREDQPGVQAEAVAGRQPAGSGRSALLLERDVLAGATGSRSGRARTAAGCGGWWTNWGWRRTAC